MDYAEALKQALEAVNSQQAQQEIAADIEAGNRTYGRLKSQEAVSRGKEQLKLAQRVADLSVDATQPLTVQTGSMMAGSGETGDISAQNQSYTDTQSVMINHENVKAAAYGAGIKIIEEIKTNSLA